MKHNLILRKDVKDNKAYYHLEIGDLKFSVVNFAKVNGTAPKELKKILFNGWESIRIRNKQLDADTIIRCKSFSDLLVEIKRIHKYHLSRVEITTNNQNIIGRFISEKNKNKIPPLSRVSETFEITPNGVGGITYTFKIENNRVTCVSNSLDHYDNNIPINSCATVDEVSAAIVALIAVLDKIST